MDAVQIAIPLYKSLGNDLASMIENMVDISMMAVLTDQKIRKISFGVRKDVICKRSSFPSNILRALLQIWSTN